MTHKLHMKRMQLGTILTQLM